MTITCCTKGCAEQEWAGFWTHPTFQSKPSINDKRCYCYWLLSSPVLVNACNVGGTMPGPEYTPNKCFIGFDCTSFLWLHQKLPAVAFLFIWWTRRKLLSGTNDGSTSKSRDFIVRWSWKQAMQCDKPGWRKKNNLEAVLRSSSCLVPPVAENLTFLLWMGRVERGRKVTGRVH